MRLERILFTMAASSIVCLTVSGVTRAAVPRAFVSTGGSDTNPCSAVQPCRSFNQALTVVEAGGEIIVQDSGGYSTGFTITQSVTIDAAGFNASVISTSATDLCTINAGATDRVVLRGISFHGAGLTGTNAINVKQVGSLYVEHCSIAEFNNEGVIVSSGVNLFVTDTDVRACLVGILVVNGSATPVNLTSHNSRFAECGDGVGLLTQGTGSVTAWFTGCAASLCNRGFVGMAQAAGNVDVTLTNCRSIGNSTGILAEPSNSSGNVIVRMDTCVVTGNSAGIVATVFSGTGIAAVLGTGPGTNLIAGNTGGNSITGSVSLQ